MKVFNETEEFPNYDLDTQGSTLRYPNSSPLKSNCSEHTFGSSYETSRTLPKQIPTVSPLTHGAGKMGRYFTRLGTPSDEMSNEDLIISMQPINKFSSQGVSPVEMSAQASSIVSVDNSTQFESIRLAPSPLNETFTFSPLDNAIRIIDVNIKRRSMFTESSEILSEQTKPAEKMKKVPGCRCFLSLGL